MTRAVVLLGAGASRDYGAPMTGPLTDAIEESIKADLIMQHAGADRAFTEIRARLAGYLKGPVNFEHIYHCVHELMLSFPPTDGAVDEFRPVLQPFVADRTGIRPETLRVLAVKIVEVIFAEVSAACADKRERLGSLAGFLGRLRARHDVTRIYTTNYDDFLVQAAPDLYTGFDPAERPGPKPFDIDGFWRKEDADAVLHLHGSVHLGFAHRTGEIGDLFWYDDRAEALLFSTFSGASSRERRMDGGTSMLSAVITGLEKLSRLQNRPMAHYYTALARDAMRADIIYIIGSGLGDLHLNTWFTEARARRPAPPILFVDYWANGVLRETMFELGRKSTEMYHALRIRLSDGERGTSIGTGWTMTEDRTAAVWERGFTAFLEAPDELDEVLATLACPAGS